MDLPVTVDLVVTQTDPGFAGDTATGAKKAADPRDGAGRAGPALRQRGRHPAHRHAQRRVRHPPAVGQRSGPMTPPSSRSLWDVGTARAPEDERSRHLGPTEPAPELSRHPSPGPTGAAHPARHRPQPARATAARRRPGARRRLGRGRGEPAVLPAVRPLLLHAEGRQQPDQGRPLPRGAGAANVRPEHGMQVICHGRLRAYEPQGVYQLYVPDGHARRAPATCTSATRRCAPSWPPRACSRMAASGSCRAGRAGSGS